MARKPHFSEVRERILELDKEQNNLEFQKMRLRDELQLLCSHERAIEVDCEVREVVSFEYLPASRMCVLCGLIENEDSSGFPMLNSSRIRTLKRVTRDEFIFFQKLQPMYVLSKKGFLD